MFDGDVDGIEEEDIKGRELLSSSEFEDVLFDNVIANAIIIASSIMHTIEIIIL